MLLSQAPRLSCSSHLLLPFVFLTILVIILSSYSSSSSSFYSIGVVEAGPHTCPSGSLHLRGQALNTATFASLTNCELLITDCTAAKIEFNGPVTGSSITIDGLICGTRNSGLEPCVDFKSSFTGGNLTFSRISVDVSTSGGISGSFALIKHAGAVTVNSVYTVRECSMTGSISGPTSALVVAIASFLQTFKVTNDALPFSGGGEVVFRSNSVKDFTVSGAANSVSIHCALFLDAVSGVSNFSLSDVDMTGNNLESTADYVRYFAVYVASSFAMSSSSPHQGGIFSVSGIKLGGTVKYADKSPTSYGVSAVEFVGLASGIHSLSVSDCSIDLSTLETSSVALANILYFRSRGISNVDTISVTGNSILGKFSAGGSSLFLFICRTTKYTKISRLEFSTNSISIIGHAAAELKAYILFVSGSGTSTGSGTSDSSVVLSSNTISGSFYTTATNSAYVHISRFKGALSDHNSFVATNNKLVDLHIESKSKNVYPHLHMFDRDLELLGLPSSTFSSSGDGMQNVTAITTASTFACFVYGVLFNGAVSGISSFSVSGLDMSSSLNYVESTTAYVRYVGIYVASSFTMSSSSSSSHQEGGIFSVSGIKLGGTVKYNDKDTTAYGVAAVFFVNRVVGVSSLSISDSSISLSRIEVSGRDVDLQVSLVRFAFISGVSNIDTVSATRCSITGPAFVTSGTDSGDTRISVFLFEKYQSLAHVILLDNVIDVIASNPFGHIYAIMLYSRAFAKGSSSVASSGLFFHRNTMSGSYFVTGFQKQLFVELLHVLVVNSINTIESRNNKFVNIHGVGEDNVKIHFFGFTSAVTLRGLPNSTISSSGDSGRNITAKSPSLSTYFHLFLFSSVSGVSNFSVANFDASDSRNYFESSTSYVRFMVIIILSPFTMSSSSPHQGGIFRVSGVKLGGTVKYDKKDGTTYGAAVLVFVGLPSGIHSVSVSNASISLGSLEATGTDVAALAYISNFIPQAGVSNVEIISVERSTIKGHFTSASRSVHLFGCRIVAYTNISLLVFSDNIIHATVSSGGGRLVASIFFCVKSSSGSGKEESALIFKNNRISGSYFGSGTATQVFVHIAGVTSLSSFNSFISENNKLSDIHAVAVDVVNVQMHAISVSLQLLDLPSSNISSTDDSLTNITSKSVTKAVELQCFNLENIGGITQFSITRLNISNCKLDAGGESSAATLSALALDVLSGSGIKKFEFENNDMLEMEKSEVISSSQDARRNFVFFASDVVVAGANFSFLENKFSSKLPVIEFDSGAQLVKGSTTQNKNFFYFKDNSLPRLDPNISNLVRFSDVNTARQQLSSAARFSFDCNEWARGLQTTFVDTTRWNGAQLEAVSSCLSTSVSRSPSNGNFTETESLSNSSSISMSQTVSETELSETDSASNGNFTATRGTFSETETVTPTPSLTHSRSPDPPQFFRSDSLLNGVAADIAATISVLSMSPQGGVGLARARRVSRMSEGCDADMKRQNPDWGGSPLQMHFGENDDLASIRGLLIGNSIFVFAFAAVMYFIARVLSELIDKPFEKCQRICRLPGVLAILWMVLVSDTAASVMVILTFSPRAKKDIIAVVVGIIFMLVLPFCLWIYILMEINYQKTKRGYGMEFVVELEDEKPEKPSHLTSRRSHHHRDRETEEQRRQRKQEEKATEAEYKKKLKEYEARMKEKQACSSIAARWFKWFMDPSVPGKEWTDTCFVQGWGLFFDMYNESSWFALFDFVVSVLSGFFEGYTDGDAPASRCVAMSACNLLLFSIHFLLLLYFWPFLSRYDKLCSFLNSMLAIIMSALSLTSHLGNDEAGDHGLEISEIIALVISLFSLLCLVDVIKCLVELYRVLTNKEQVEPENQSMSEFGSQLREQLISPSSSSSRSPRSRFNHNNHDEEEEEEAEEMLAPRHQQQRRRVGSLVPVEIVSPRSRPSSSSRRAFSSSSSSPTAAAASGGRGGTRSRSRSRGGRQEEDNELQESPRRIQQPQQQQRSSSSSRRRAGGRTRSS